MAPRLSTRSLRSQPKLSNGGAAADLFSAKKPDIKIVRAANRDIAEAIAKRVFQNIARELGSAGSARHLQQIGSARTKKATCRHANRMISQASTFTMADHRLRHLPAGSPRSIKRFRQAQSLLRGVATAEQVCRKAVAAAAAQNKASQQANHRQTGHIRQIGKIISGGQGKVLCRIPKSRWHLALSLHVHQRGVQCNRTVTRSAQQKRLGSTKTKR